MSDLRRLVDAVEAGTLPEPVFHGSSAIRGHWAYTTGLDARQRTDVFLAYNGSLDAAKALHDALLPGWRWWRKPDGTMAVAIAYPYTWFEQDTSEIDPARAWLLVILRAKAAEGGE